MRTVTRTIFLGVIGVWLTASFSGCAWLDKYNVRFGLKADMSDSAPDPNSVAVLGTSSSAKKPVVRRPPQEVLTTEGVDEALDDDLDNSNPVAAAAKKEEVKATSDLVNPTESK